MTFNPISQCFDLQVEGFTFSELVHNGNIRTIIEEDQTVFWCEKRRSVPNGYFILWFSQCLLVVRVKRESTRSILPDIFKLVRDRYSIEQIRSICEGKLKLPTAKLIDHHVSLNDDPIDWTIFDKTKNQRLYFHLVFNGPRD